MELKRIPAAIGRRILVSILFVILPWQVSPANAEIVFYEGFESGIGEWTVTNGVWEVGPPTSGPQGCRDNSTQCASTVLVGNYPNYTDSRLVSPEIQLPPIEGNEEIQIVFNQWFSYYPYDWSSSRDWGRVQISTHDDQAGWSGWEDVGNRIQDYGNVWSLMAVDLTAYAGMRVRVGFYHSSDEQDTDSGWYIDDVSVVKKTPEFDGTFEGGWGDWHADRGVWQVGEGAGPEGEGRFAGTVFDGSYPNFTDSRLVSPTFALPSDLGAGEEIHLRFWQRFSYYPYDWSSSRDWGQVQISTHDDQTGWSDWVNVGNRVQDYGNVWSMMAVDLTAYAGMRVRVAFYHSSDEGDVSSGWYVDDVSVVKKTPEFDGTFDGGWGDWYADRGVWQIGEGAGPEGEGRYAGTVFDGSYPDFTDSRLVSPTFELPSDLGAGEEINLRFWQRFSYYPYDWSSSRDWGQVQISTHDDQAGWSEWAGVGNLVRDYSNAWSMMAVDLTAYAGMRVRVAFYHSSDEGDVSSGWYVDDVRVVKKTPEFDGTFDGGWGGWYADRGVWQIGEGAGPEGEGRFAGTVFDGSYPNFTDSRLVSPTFALPSDLGAGEEIHLRFWQRFSYYPYDWSSSRDWGQVQISTHDDQTGWSEWAGVGNLVRDYSNAWSMMAVDLTAYAGMRVRVAFYHSSDEGDVSSGWYVDDVSVVKKTPEFDGTFDGGWGGWYADRGVWQIGEGAGPEGEGRFAGTVFDGSYPNFTDSRLVSPTFALPSDLGAGEEIHLVSGSAFPTSPPTTGLPAGTGGRCRYRRI